MKAARTRRSAATLAQAAAPDPFTPDEVNDFGSAVTQRLGHFQDVARAADLAAVLRLRMRLTGSTRYRTYRDLLAQAAEWEALAPLLTVPETYFFRMPTHFDALADAVLPALIEQRRGSRSLRLLSAGCATGEEPYSLRILLNERFPELADWDVSITGVDLSLDSLERAKTGVYSEWSLRATSASRRTANFVREDKRFRLQPGARAGVVFHRENLLAPPPDNEKKYDIIFCRNVLIYFTDHAMRAAIARLTQRLVAGGTLFLGPAESLRGISDDFELCRAREVFFYRLRSLEERSAGGASRPASRVSAWERRPARNATLTAGGSPVASDCISAAPEGAWYTTIDQSWQRLAALVPGRPDPLSSVPAARSSPRMPATMQDALSPSAIAAAAVLRPLAEAADGEAEASFFALVAAERFAQALDLLETMQAPGRAAAIDARGLLRASMLTNLGRYPEAEAECKLLLTAYQNDAGAHFLLGLCREQEGAFAEAAEQMARTIALDPSFSMAHLHRGLIARREGNLVAARSAFTLALGAMEHEESRRLTLFGGGLSRASLQQLCRRELERMGYAPLTTRADRDQRSRS